MKTKDQNSRRKIYIGIIIGAIIILLFMMPVFYIHKVDVVNNSVYSKEDIIEAAQIKEKHILDFSYIRVEDKIKQLPYIEDAKIEYVFPGKLKIEVMEKKPFAYLDFSGGHICVNEQGQVIEQTNVKRHELPTIKGVSFDRFKVGEVLEVQELEEWNCAVEVIKHLEKHLFTDKIKAIDVYNIEEIHLYVDNLDVIMGNIGDFDKKIEVLIKIHEEYDMGILDFRAYSTRGEVLLKPIT